MALALLTVSLKNLQSITEFVMCKLSLSLVYQWFSRKSCPNIYVGNEDVVDWYNTNKLSCFLIDTSYDYRCCPSELLLKHTSIHLECKSITTRKILPIERPGEYAAMVVLANLIGAQVQLDKRASYTDTDYIVLLVSPGLYQCQITRHSCKLIPSSLKFILGAFPS